MQVQEMTITELLTNNIPLSNEEFDLLINKVRSNAIEQEAFSQYLNDTITARGADLESDPSMAMKIGQGFFALCQWRQAATWLDKAGNTSTALTLKGRTLEKANLFAEAIQAFETAEEKGADSFDTAMTIVNCLRQSGRLEEAAEKLKRVSRVGEFRAEYHYQLARIQDDNGEHTHAIQTLKKTIVLDSNHTEALFHLAYISSLYGSEEEAIEYYIQCIGNSPSAPINALLNLSVLYEDCGEFYKASECVAQVLKAFPNHPRANMFMKDLQSSMTMFYDEDQERRTDHRNKVMEIPISDFELSVRSRNCLKKMNIRTLGDLLKVTEAELLAYKNFGETSLLEIKQILSTKGLRLGQMLEDNKKGAAKKQAANIQKADQELLDKPIDSLELSVRSRKCLERLNVISIRDLCNCTEAELLGCKNFGQTSLVEVQQKLGQKNLSLRKLDD